VARVLVADDNSNIQKMVTLALKDQGIDVVSVGNGEAAIRKLPDLSPDLVLADIFMPVRSGYEVCEFVKRDARFAHIPVILLVGAFDPLDEHEAKRVGADGVLKKPFVPPEPLIKMVKAALEQSARQRPVPVAVPVGATVATSVATQRATSAGQPPPTVASATGEPAPIPVTAEPADEVPPNAFSPQTESIEFREGEKPLAFGDLLRAPAAESAHEPPPPSESGPSPFGGAGIGEKRFWQSASAKEEPATERGVEHEVPAWSAAGSDPVPLRPTDSEAQARTASGAYGATPPADSNVAPGQGQPAFPEATRDEIPWGSNLFPWMSKQPAPPAAAPEDTTPHRVPLHSEMLVENAADKTATNASETSEQAALTLEPPATPPRAEYPLPGLGVEEVPFAARLKGGSLAGTSETAPEQSTWLPPGGEVKEVPPGSNPVIEATKASPWSQYVTELDQPGAPGATGPATSVWDQSAEHSPLEVGNLTEPAEGWPAGTSPPGSTPAVAGTSPAQDAQPASVWPSPISSPESAPRAVATEPPPLAVGLAASDAVQSFEVPRLADPTIVEAVVARVIERMQPQILDIVTREILKPVVEALVRREIEKG